LVYDELRRLAAAPMAREKLGKKKLDATALVHEAYLRLVGDQHFENRRHFFAAEAEAMRRILVENARREQRDKHGGRLVRRPIDQIDVATSDFSEDLLLRLGRSGNRVRKPPPGVRGAQRGAISRSTWRGRAGCGDSGAWSNVVRSSSGWEIRCSGPSAGVR
jgi:hypothetical protein